MDIDLERPVKAQETAYPRDLSEIHAGRKQIHRMWYIVPQIQRLLYSYEAAYYAMDSKRFVSDTCIRNVFGADALIK